MGGGSTKGALLGGTMDPIGGPLVGAAAGRGKGNHNPTPPGPATTQSTYFPALAAQASNGGGPGKQAPSQQPQLPQGAWQSNLGGANATQRPAK